MMVQFYTAITESSVVSPARTARNLGVTLDTSVPQPSGAAGSGPGSCHLTTGLLQLALGWCVYMSHPTSAAHTECSWSLTYPSSSTPHHSFTPCTGYWVLLESDSRHWYLPTVPRTAQAHLTSRTGSNPTPQPVHYTLSLKASVCSLGSTMVKQAHHWHRDSRKSTHLPSQTENSSVQTAPWPIKKEKSFYIYLSKCCTWSCSAYLMKLMFLHDSCNFGIVST